MEGEIMDSDDFSDILEPFGLLRKWMQEIEQDRERYDYGKKKPGRPESKLEALVGRALEAQGIPVEHQVRCEAGIADIVTSDAIYEVKSDIRYPGKLYEAIGQVLVYRQLINPSAQVFVVGYSHVGGHSQKQLAAIQAAAKGFGVQIVFWQKEEVDPRQRDEGTT
jgi:hypothetical protein